VAAIPDSAPGQRIDKWLWAARFFKTRSLAAEAVAGGKVHVDGERVKPARLVRPGSLVRVRKGEVEYTVSVESTAARRGPAPEAAHLYTETEASRRQRETRAAERRAAAASHPAHGSGRPSKRDRRRLEQITGR
jgi:ribosome-associated heat shock protein Hsp15